LNVGNAPELGNLKLMHRRLVSSEGGDGCADPLDAQEMDPSTEYCLRLSRAPLIVGIVIALVFPATWFLERFALLDVNGIAWNPVWTTFVFGFVCPFSLLLLYMVWRHHPIIRVSDSAVFLRHVTLPWKTTEFSTTEVNCVLADWEPNTSHCCLQIKVSRSCFDRESVRNPWLCGKDGFLTMRVNNTEETPDQVATTLNFLLSDSEKTTA